MTDPLTLYKLIVLYMLDQVDFPLTKAQIFDFMLGKEYTNYFTLQQVACELIDTDLVESKSIRNSSHLTITDEGRDTLKFFEGRISDAIRSDIDAYFKDNEMKLRNEVSTFSNYYKVTNGEYIAELVAKEKNNELINLKLSMPTEEGVRSICENWQKKSSDIYAYLMQELM